MLLEDIAILIQGKISILNVIFWFGFGFYY